MAILLDTQAIVWIALDDPRLSTSAIEAILAPDQNIAVSAFTAHEFADLNRRGRFGVDLPLDEICGMLGATIVDFPAACWRIAADLPPIHRDPVDRMTIAHVIHADLTLITADATLRSYPVRSV